MQISNILSSFTDTLSLGKKTDNAVSTAAKAGTTADAAAVSSSSRKVLAEIMKKYDVTNITPEAYSRMLKELYQGGAISEKELQELSAIRSDLESAKVGSNETVNLVEFYNDRIRQAQKQFDTAGTSTSQQEVLAPLVTRLGWLEKFSTIHSNPDMVGMDLAA
jgi:hypothetical protein